MPTQGRNGRDNWITADHRIKTVHVLTCMRRKREGDTPRPINAFDLGRYVGVPAGHSDNDYQRREYIRRRVRELIADLRVDSWPIIGVNAGYYLADEVEDFAAYKQHVEARAKRQLARINKLKQSQGLADMSGQLSMFPMQSVAIATHRY